jgi:hypothetical protein
LTAGGLHLFEGRLIADQNTVIPAMIVALKFDEAPAACNSTRQPQRNLHNLSPAVGVTNQASARDNLLQHLGHFIFELVLGAVSVPALELRGDGL